MKIFKVVPCDSHCELPKAIDVIQSGSLVSLYSDGEHFNVEAWLDYQPNHVNGIALHDAMPGQDVRAAVRGDVTGGDMSTVEIWGVIDE